MHWVTGVGHGLLQEAGQRPGSLLRWGGGEPLHTVPASRASPRLSTGAKRSTNNCRCWHSGASRGLLSLGCWAGQHGGADPGAPLRASGARCLLPVPWLLLTQEQVAAGMWGLGMVPVGQWRPRSLSKAQEVGS